MARLDKAWIKHMRTHMLLYIETIVKSIPRSIVSRLPSWARPPPCRSSLCRSASSPSSAKGTWSGARPMFRSSSSSSYWPPKTSSASSTSSPPSSPRTNEVGRFGSSTLFVSRLSYGWLILVLMVAIYFGFLLIGSGVGPAVDQYLHQRVRRGNVGFAILVVVGGILLAILVLGNEVSGGCEAPVGGAAHHGAGTLHHPSPHSGDPLLTCRARGLSGTGERNGTGRIYNA